MSRLTRQAVWFLAIDSSISDPLICCLLIEWWNGTHGCWTYVCPWMSAVLICQQQCSWGSSNFCTFWAPIESTRDALTIGHPRSSLLAKHGKQRKHAWLRPCTWAMLTSSSTFGSGVCRLITDMSLLFASILDSESHIESRHPLLYANPHLYLNLHSDRTNIDGHSDSAFYSDRDSLEPGQTDHHHFKSSFTRLSQRWTRCWSHANAQRYWH